MAWNKSVELLLEAFENSIELRAPSPSAIASHQTLHNNPIPFFKYPIHPTLTPLFQLNRIDSFSILYSLATIYFILFGINLATKAKSLIKKALARSVCSIVWLRASSGNFQRFSSFVKWFHYWNWTRKPELLCPDWAMEKCLKWLRFKLDFPPSISRPFYGCCCHVYESRGGEIYHAQKSECETTLRISIQIIDVYTILCSLYESIWKWHLKNFSIVSHTSRDDVAFKVFLLSTFAHTGLFEICSLLITKEDEEKSAYTRSNERMCRVRENRKTTKQCRRGFDCDEMKWT